MSQEFRLPAFRINLNINRDGPSADEGAKSFPPFDFTLLSVATEAATSLLELPSQVLSSLNEIKIGFRQEDTKKPEMGVIGVFEKRLGVSEVAKAKVLLSNGNTMRMAAISHLVILFRQDHQRLIKELIADTQGNIDAIQGFVLEPT